jgi:carboxyl-terminal processing protease
MSMTKAMLTRSLGAVLAVLALTLSVRAEEARGSSQPYVVLVGISNYADKQIKPRPHAEDDAKALYDLFTSQKYLGVDAKHVRLLLGSEDTARKSEKATRENVLKALQWVAGSAGVNDLVIVAFFGEGGPLGESGDRRCYFTADSTFKGRDKDALAASDVGEALKNLKSHRFCVLLDVNFKGFDAGGGATAIAEPTLGNAPYKEFLGDDGSEDHLPKAGRVLFLATNGLSASLDLKDHGLFTEALLDGLKGGADKDGYEPDGSITVEELTKYLEKKIPQLAGKFGKTEEEKLQLHYVLGVHGNHFALTKNPEVADKVQARLEKLDKMLKDGTLPAKYSDEARTLLERMPRLEAQRNLRKQYQQLVDGTINLDKFETERKTILAGTNLRRADAVEYAQKVMEAVQFIQENYVKKLDAGEMVGWGIRGLYRRIDEKVPPEIEARLKKVKDLGETELAVLLADARQGLGKREDLDKHKDIDITLQRMTSHLDPYTTYIDPETKAKFDNDIKGYFTGIGIQIRKDTATDQLLVVTPIKGSPAYKAGLQAGDIITTVTTAKVHPKTKEPLDEIEVIPTKGLPLNDAVKRILGKENTKVKLTVVREGSDKPLEFEIIRNKVTVESVLGHKRKTDDDWDFMIDPQNKIGYIRLTTFSKNSYDDMRQAMRDLVKAGIKGFILDLRFNPGGLLQSAVDISDLYIDDGLIVSIRPRVGQEHKFTGKHRGSLLEFPMVCLVNGLSASGSEIVSAALQDHGRAYIIGERSYGKGSVQNIQEFDGGDIKLTTASFWRPSGKNLNKASTDGKDEDVWGVTPDLVIKLSRKEREDLYEAQHKAEVIQRKDRAPKEKEAKTEFKDRQLEEALKYLRGQIKTASRVPETKGEN